MRKNLILPLTLAVVIFGIAAFQMMGLIDIRGILNQSSPANNTNISTHSSKCIDPYPYCGKGAIDPNKPVGPNNPVTQGTQVLASCDCPSNTYLVQDFGSNGKYCECR